MNQQGKKLRRRRRTRKTKRKLKWTKHTCFSSKHHRATVDCVSAAKMLFRIFRAAIGAARWHGTHSGAWTENVHACNVFYGYVCGLGQNPILVNRKAANYRLLNRKKSRYHRHYRCRRNDRIRLLSFVFAHTFVCLQRNWRTIWLLTKIFTFLIWINLFKPPFIHNNNDTWKSNAHSHTNSFVLNKSRSTFSLFYVYIFFCLNRLRYWRWFLYLIVCMRRHFEYKFLVRLLVLKQLDWGHWSVWLSICVWLCVVGECASVRLSKCVRSVFV